MSGSQSDAAAAPIDGAALAEIACGDPAAERRLLNVFRTANDTDAAALRAALDKRDAAAVVRAAHRLMGAARIAGATVLAGICAAVAQAGRTFDWDGMALHNRALCHELARVNAYVNARLSAPAVPAARCSDRGS